MNQAIGWLSSAILVLTISTQLRKQWRSRSSQGVSKWLYIGQIAASTGFVIYSVQSRDWVFVVTNTVLGLEALFGLGLVLAQRRAARAHVPAGRMVEAHGSAREQTSTDATSRRPA
jgi:uncharacterized protein with PQ loop repeat